MNREEIKKMAKQKAEEDIKSNPNNIMIPIIKGSNYELVPLSSLTKEEIIDYVQSRKTK